MRVSGCTRLMWGSVLVVSLMIGACASPPRANLELESSIEAYERLVENPLSEQLAPQDIKRARASLEQATTVWREKEGTQIVDHRAYVARQYVKIAEFKVEVAEAKLETRELQLQHSIVLADLRAQQANAARADATRAQAEALRLAAETRRLQQQVESRELQLTQQRQELEALKELQARQTDRGMVLTLGDVLFDTGKSTLKPGSIKNLDKIAAFMERYSERRITIEGHTDDVGGVEYNRELSIDRALAIRGALEARSIDPNRISTSGQGESVPIASNETAAGRQLNRRVEIIFENETLVDDPVEAAVINEPGLVTPKEVQEE